MGRNIVCEEDNGLTILKIFMSDNRSISNSNDVLEKIRAVIKPLCVILDNHLMELWLYIEALKLHEIIYKIITLMSIPINVYVSGLYGVPQPLLVNGVYNRNIRLELISRIDAGRKVIDDETIELLCYEELHECLNKAYMLLRNEKIKSFNMRKEGTKYRIIARLSEPICVTELVKQCLRIEKLKPIPP